ncbi:hypothetical protein, partial [Cronobacter sakazakii]
RQAAMSLSSRRASAIFSSSSPRACRT